MWVAIILPPSQRTSPIVIHLVWAPKKGKTKTHFSSHCPYQYIQCKHRKNLADGERVYIYHVFSILTFTKYNEMNNQTQLSRSSNVGRHKITTVSHHLTHTNTSSLGKKKRKRKKPSSHSDIVQVLSALQNIFRESCHPL